MAINRLIDEAQAMVRFSAFAMVIESYLHAKIRQINTLLVFSFGQMCH